jgi:hypothetical protein
MQSKRGNGRAVKWRPGVQRIVAQRIERAAVKIVGAGLGDHLHLDASGRSALRRVDRGAHAELGDRIERDVEARLGLLRLLLHAVVVDAVERVVGIVDRVAVEADAALRAVAVVDRAGR